VFSTQVITCLDREALYVLDGLLDHQTDLNIIEHTADTHGYTEQMFGLCFLLGFSFMPRIKGAEDQYLYRMDPSQRFGELDPFFVDTVDIALILEQWDALVRLTASLRQRVVPAHIVIQRLRHDSCRLGRALTALGRLVKTIYLLRFMADADLRRHILLQLNRGENRHFLARWLFFAQQGELAVGDLPGLINKASCLSLLSNAVLVWNTVQFEKIVTQLRSQGHTINNEDLAHVTPLLFGHIIPHGAYFINQPDPRG
jgi:TnpA family transposase